MAKSSPLHLIISTLLITALTVVVSAQASGGYSREMPIRHGCQGSIAECMGGDDVEFEMDSEINRRILATTNYISYGALQRNNIPCSQRGASYYNCRPGAQANPYNRGCNAITRCRS